MTRYEKAFDYHVRGFNCCQSVIAAFADEIGMTEQECFDLGGGFGGGAGTGELCGAIVGGIMVLGKLTPVDPADPVGSKKRTQAKGKKLQAEFEFRFRHLRCADLVKEEEIYGEAPMWASHVEIRNRCDAMILTAVELVELIMSDML
jgi:C_GCAxxG_C_C family probable redox protein